MNYKHIEIGGKQRPIGFPPHALREIERMTGVAFLLTDWLKYESRIAAAYAGLKWGLYKQDGREPRPDFNELQVADWIGAEMHDDSINGQILQILNEWLPKPKNVEAGSNPAEQQ